MGTLGPEDLAELISCDDLSLLPKEHLQDAKGLLLNPERNPVTGEASASQINLEETKSHFDCGIGFGHRLATPKRCDTIAWRISSREAVHMTCYLFYLHIVIRS
jgi:hypothetical protein